MLNLIFSFISLILGICFFLISRSQNIYEKTANEYGREFAEKNFKVMRIGSYLLLGISIIYLIVVLYV